MTLLLANYANDLAFAEDANLPRRVYAWRAVHTSKGTALIVLNIAAVRASILQELHDSNYAGHVGIHTIYSVRCA